MRSDMSKVIVERPRVHDMWGKDGRKFSRGKKDPDTFPSKEPMSRGRGSKTLTDNLNPLYRFLVKSIGRPWSAVYSEICQNVPADSSQHLHVRNHVWDFVETNIRIVDGVPHYLPRYVSRSMRTGDEGWEPYTQESYRYRRNIKMYVCPSSGLLKRAPKARPVERKEPNKAIKIDSIRYAALIKGHWFEVEVAHMPVDSYDWKRYRDCDAWDIVFERRASECRYERSRFYDPGITYDFVSRDVYAVKKRQMSKREIKRLQDLKKI